MICSVVGSSRKRMESRRKKKPCSPPRRNDSRWLSQSISRSIASWTLGYTAAESPTWRTAPPNSRDSLCFLPGQHIYPVPLRSLSIFLLPTPPILFPLRPNTFASFFPARYRQIKQHTLNEFPRSSARVLLFTRNICLHVYFFPQILFSGRIEQRTFLNINGRA